MSAEVTNGGQQSEPVHLGKLLARVLALILVIIGLLQNIPSIPGLDAAVASVIGDNFYYRRFPPEILFPVLLVFMMTIVAMHHSWGRKAQEAKRSNFTVSLGYILDLLLVFSAISLAVAYLAENQAVCLFDQFTGKRSELIEKTLKAERELAAIMGLPEPTSVDDPSCYYTTGVWLFLIVGVAVAVFLTYNVGVWGFPLVMVTILIALYTLVTISVWYFLGSDGLNRYYVTRIGGEENRQLIDGLPRIQDILLNGGSGLLGRFMSVLYSSVFPYLVLGSLFGISAGGRSMIKLAFIWTRNLRGGPAHAAVMSSAIFGTISGGPVVNVLSTGVLTIPMMLKRGFDRMFAGGVEAAASSGGQIMPPVMGVAAFLLAALTLVPYRLVIIAATLPAIAYFSCLFLTILFQSRKQGIEKVGDITVEMKMTRADWVNFSMIVVPILLILFLLLTPKDAVGCGVPGSLFGVNQIITETGCRAPDLPWLFQLIQNSAGDTGAAGWWAVILLICLLFLGPEMRAHPRRLLVALADGGILVATLFLMFLAISVIDFSLNLTDLSGNISRDVLALISAWREALGGAGRFLFGALLMTMVLSILLGMGMPSVPAYLNVILLMGPLLVGLGIATFTTHMFVFYFAVASAITPPVALAAFAAASITKAEPMATAFSAVRAGIVMFVIPFVFCFYPELLLIEAAVIAPSGVEVILPDGTLSRYISGYENGIQTIDVFSIVARLIVALYLLASGLAAYDLKALTKIEIALRLVLFVLILAKSPLIFIPSLGVAFAYFGWHYFQSKSALRQGVA
ncbi:MAG: TRAP transporter large permease subunit [Aestuariivita sp.]|nr:TRAP transporter large permease subunit [Aestuariivita sp.]